MVKAVVTSGLWRHVFQSQSSFRLNNSPPSSGSEKEISLLCFLPGFMPITCLFLRYWRWRRIISSKRQLTLNALHGITSQKIKQAKLVSRENKQTNSVAFRPKANYTDWSTAIFGRNLVPTFVGRGVARGQRGGSPTVVNLSSRSRFAVEVRQMEGKNIWDTAKDNPLWKVVLMLQDRRGRRDNNCGAEYHSRGHQLRSLRMVSQHLMEHEGSLPRSQELLSCPSHEPHQSNPVNTIP
jgi:hypothetical protein